MAIHHPTPPFAGSERPRLPSAQVGPVTQALRACRPVDRADLAIADIQIGLASFFADADRQRVRELRRRIADRIEADLALLDALDPDPEAEGTALERAGRGFELSGHDDAEDGHDAEANTDDNGIADSHALGEQGFPGYGGCL